jgi:adenylate cyclase, class 2
MVMQDRKRGCHVQHLNIEVKARCADPDRIRAILKANGADFRGTDRQLDTYFKVSHGRLKLREGLIENSLVFYEREDRSGPKQSSVILFQTDPGSVLKDILVKAQGVLVVIDKIREIYFIENVKFHIDVVKGLGSFLEIEVMETNLATDKKELLAQCRQYLRLFSVSESELVPYSYSDLLLQKA